MITGKAVSTAWRGHFLVQAALVKKLISAVMPNIEIESTEDMKNDDGSSSETQPLDTNTGSLLKTRLELKK